MAYGARLESGLGASPQGFESPILRHHNGNVIRSGRCCHLAMPGLLLAGNPDEGPLIGNLKPMPGLAGRGRLVTRDRGTETVQVAWTDTTL